MINYEKTLKTIKGGLLDSDSTWQSYLAENKDWKETLIGLTAPLIIVSVILSAILGWLFSSFSPFGYQGGIGSILLRLIGAFVGILLASFIFSFFASVFKGKHNFSKGVAALSLAAIPAYIGGIFSTIPFIGWLIGLGLAIVSLIFLYKIIPSYLEVPKDKRILHFIVSLVATFIVAFIINMVLGIGGYKSGAFDGNSLGGTSGNKSSSMLGGIGRQVDLIEEADNDRYSPSVDGKITENQIATLILNIKKTENYRKSQENKLKDLDEKMKDKKGFSFSDIGKLTSGINSVMSTANAEMEVVKTGGGNWAEHQWVKDQLRIANIQKDINDAVKHNYALYQKYANQLGGL